MLHMFRRFCLAICPGVGAAAGTDVATVRGGYCDFRSGGDIVTLGQLSCNLSRSLSSSWDRRGDSEADRARSSRARTSVGEDGDPVLGRDSNKGS